MTDQNKKLKVISVTPLEAGAEIELHDLQISASDATGTIHMVDMQLSQEEEANESYCITPGVWRVTPKAGLQPLELPEETYFETDTYRTLTKKFDAFMSKLDSVYGKYGLTKKRSFLLGSAPGVGKTSLIRQFNRKIRSMDGVCILHIDSEGVSWETIISMFIKSKAEDAKFVVLVIEDIGGAGLHESRADVSSTLLNFLDGNSDCFKIPTLVIATTNFLNEVGGQLTNRPGRFDLVLTVEPPKDSEIKFLLESFLKRDITEAEAKAVLGHKFTPAYAREALLRSELDDITIQESVKQVLAQRDKSEKKSHGQNGKAFGFNRDEEGEG